MRFSLSAFYDPKRNALFSVLATAVTIYFYAYSLVYGAVGVLITYAVWFPLIVIRLPLIKVRMGEALLFVFPLFALLSGFWADDQLLSFRFAIQLLSTMACAYLAGRVVTTQNLLIGTALGSIAVGIAALLDGTTGTYGDTQYLIGSFGSKNQLGLLVSIGALAAFVYPLIGKSSLMPKVLAGLAVAFLIWILSQTNSATSLVSFTAASGVFLGFVFYRRLSPAVRSVVLPFLVAGTVALASIALLLLPLGEFFGLLGRSEDLSGRTGLWQSGIDAFFQRPVLGYGYQGFWVAGRQAAELLWAANDVWDKTGFHFHNAFLEVLVDLGALGLVIYIPTLALIIWAQTKGIFSQRLSRRGIIYLSFTVYFLSRTFSEIDIYYQFAVGTFLFYTFAFKAVRRAPLGRRRSRRSRLARRRSARSGRGSLRPIAGVGQPSTLGVENRGMIHLSRHNSRRRVSKKQ